LLISLLAFLYIGFNTGCGQIGMPTGGDRDSLPPVLIKATPEQQTVNFADQRISLQFDEYIQVQDAQQQVIVSPYQKRNPTIISNLRTIRLRFRDSLLPNTTYSIQFGKSISDINEGNILENFTYVFSTGASIDSLTLRGNVVLAQTGETDSTLMAMLYRDAVDSSVKTRPPDYLAKVNAEGNFQFSYLPAGDFKLYILGDGDGSKTYNANAEVFAFLPENETVRVQDTVSTLKLWAYAAEKKENSPKKETPQKDKKLSYSINQSGQRQDLLSPLQITYNTPLQKIDTQSIVLTDTLYVPVPGALLTVDSTRKILTYEHTWEPGQAYRLLIPQEAIEDSTGRQPEKSDTLHFVTQEESEYGSLVLRFNGIPEGSQPVLQLYRGTELYISAAIINNQWRKRLMPPGEYGIKILLDENGNEVWDPGNYDALLQPEKVIHINLKIKVGANWDNEQDISL